jgi:hypothetical protein
MDEFGSALCGVSELGVRKWINAPAASISCFQERHPPSRTREFACSHQTSRPRADDHNVLSIWF